MAKPFKAPAPVAGELHDSYLTRLAKSFEEWANARFPPVDSTPTP